MRQKLEKWWKRIIIAGLVISIVSVGFVVYPKQKQIVLTFGMFAGNQWNVPDDDCYKMIDQAIKEFEEEYKGEALGRRGKEYCLFNLIYPQKSIGAKIQAERDNEYKEVKKVVKAEIIMIKEKAKNFRNKEKINIDDETKRIAEKLSFLEDNLKIITNLKELNFLVKNPQKLKDDMLQSEFIEELLMKLKAVEEQEKDENKYDNQKYGIDKVKLLLNFLEKIINK